MNKSTIIKFVAVVAVVAVAVVVALHVGPDFLATARKHMGMM